MYGITRRVGGAREWAIFPVSRAAFKPQDGHFAIVFYGLRGFTPFSAFIGVLFPIDA